MKLDYNVEGGDFARAGWASSQVKKVLKQLNVDQGVIKRVVVALYEAEVNIVAHAYRGTITVNIDAEKIRMTLEDEGPGIPDIPLAMQRGYSTASPQVREMGFGAGMGLPNIDSNADNFDIKTNIGVGTTLEITINLKPQQE
ncbi:ATP-binding protein [Acetobacteroides hydrogenigenes]|uniref:Anti-sigma regulatory factor (Ser/Thr protein kinase) n=1 Tax=Acetobacteroides hydrogenigenes TaxID=979970 RepID=A0A4R2EHJ9_9BACT|nr:anti-sigma regulatory factor [Acetobacteroides hydrogenigenes]TCN67547.1 anti-sigma regulatory factor (Ser/Thr protein kinase) [Acetobacteroides hydrogenigenes]